jgi:hypothetical protein
MKLNCLSALACAGLLTGCSVRVADCTIASTKNIDFEKLSKSKLGSKRTSGEDMKLIVIVIPAGIPNLKTAVDKAIEAVPGCIALSDVAVYNKGFYIPLVIGSNGYVVEGTPIIDPSSSTGGPSPKVVRVDMTNQTAQVLNLSSRELSDLRKQMN